MPLSNASDGWIAGHLAERIDAVGKQERTPAHSGSSKRRLGAGVATAYDNHIESIRMVHHQEVEQRATIIPPAAGWGKRRGSTWNRLSAGSTWNLFADTKTRKDLAEQIIRRDFARYFSQRLLHHPQFLGEQFQLSTALCRPKQV